MSISATLAAPLAVEAATIAYWRFEDAPGYLADSSGNDHVLTNNGSVGQAPAIGYPATILGQSNASISSFNGANWLSTPDSNTFTSNTFTLETYFNATATNGTRFIAGQQLSAGVDPDQRSYYIAVRDGAMRIQISPNGSGEGNRTLDATSLTVLPNKVYYAAMVVDIPNDVATVYLQNITDSGSLTSVTFSGADVPSQLHNSTGDFSIGATATGGAGFAGTIDEVRLSNAALSESELLVAVPEPAALSLLAISGLAMLRRRRA